MGQGIELLVPERFRGEHPAHRAGEIIRAIRGMLRKGEEVRGPVNLNDVIASVLRFVH